MEGKDRRKILQDILQFELATFFYAISLLNIKKVYNKVYEYNFHNMPIFP